MDWLPHMKLRVVDGVTVACWKCFLETTVGFAEDGNPMVVHRNPRCEAWEKIETVEDASDYLARCRAARTA